MTKRGQNLRNTLVRAQYDPGDATPNAPLYPEFETLLRLADARHPPRCPQCGSKGVWRYRIHRAVFTHWVCESRSVCGWQAIAADGAFRQGVPNNGIH